jgi:purine/pyrimidine-nucleoside phosphorylase
MSEFKNVSVVKMANIYFDGKVTSRTITFRDGTKKTLGIMLPGDYEFGTEKKEVMVIMSGELDVKLPGSRRWLEIKAGDEFEVPAGSRFKLRIKRITDYCCSYVD